MKNLTNHEGPSYLINFPSSFSTKEPNNIWMKEADPEELEVDLDYAIAQWNDLYNALSAQSIVQILPTPKNVFIISTTV